VGKRHHRRHHRHGFGIVQHRADEGAVDLQLVDRQAREIAEGRVSGAEVVDRDLQAMLAKRGELGDTGLDVVHQDAFRDLEVDPRRLRRRHRALHDCDELGTMQLDHRDIDRHAGRIEAQPAQCSRSRTACSNAHAPTSRIIRSAPATG
jgi:stage V sporulation protein SpoVS